MGGSDRLDGLPALRLPGPTQFIQSLSDALLLVVVLVGLAYIASGATGITARRVTWVIAGIALAPILDLTWAVTNVVSTLVGNVVDPAARRARLDATRCCPGSGLIGVDLRRLRLPLRARRRFSFRDRPRRDLRRHHRRAAAVLRRHRVVGRADLRKHAPRDLRQPLCGALYRLFAQRASRPRRELL